MRDPEAARRSAAAQTFPERPGAGLRTAYKSFGGIDWVYTLADTLGLYERSAIPPALAVEAAA